MSKSIVLAVASAWAALIWPGTIEGGPGVEVREIGPFWGQTIHVGAGESIEAAVGSAHPGDRIVLAGPSYCETIFIEISGLIIEGAEGVGVVWHGSLVPGESTCVSYFPRVQPYPTVIANQPVEITLRNLSLGGTQGGYEAGMPFGVDGGHGGSAVAVNSDLATLHLIDCRLTGGAGGPGSSNSELFCNQSAGGSGGDGGHGIEITGSNPVFADSATTFKEGAGGLGQEGYEISTDPPCVLHGTPAGYGGLPVYSRNGAIIQTVSIIERIPDRANGDFDGTGCADINDLLFMLDYWQASFEGTALGLGDFLSLVDHWNSGPRCS